VLEFREPPRTGFELAWSLVGIRFRVMPSFFLIAAVIAFLFVGFNAIAIAIDVGCIFFAIVFTEFVQGLVYRSYGLRSTVVVQDFGGGVYPEREPATALERIVAALSSPASSFLLFAVVYFSNEKYDWENINAYSGFAFRMLRLVSLFWGIIGLLPIFPHPCGRVMMELLTLVSPRHGLATTLVISIVLALAYIAYTVAVYSRSMQEIPLLKGAVLPASIIVSVFLGFATARNWQLLQMVRAQQRPYQTDQDEYDDRAPWER
jgi:stage IV sporulation protein FB